MTLPPVAISAGQVERPDRAKAGELGYVAGHGRPATDG
jgi:hypothetical protein